jgi:hypothetical protein
MEPIQHSVTIEGRKKFSATAIESVNSFSDRQIILGYSGGKIVVTGSGMKIVAFSKTGGAFVAVGEIDSVRYTGGGGIKQRLFK